MAKAPSNEVRRRAIDLHSALRPLRLASQFMGLNLEGRFARLYAFMLFVMIIFFLYASCIHLTSDHIEILTQVDALILWTQLVSNAIIIVSILGASIIRPYQFQFPVQEMRQVDTRLRSLGGEISNSYLRRLQFIQISVWGLILVALGAPEIKEVFEHRKFYVFLHCLHYSYAVSSSVITDCIFVDYLVVIGMRYSKLNQLLFTILKRSRPTLDLSFFIRVNDRSGGCKDSPNDILVIEKLRLVHHDLYGISNKVNESFGIQLLVTTGISVIMITGQLYEAYHFMNSGVNLVGMAAQKLTWILFHVGRLFYISRACSRTNTEAKTTSRIIHKLPLHHLSNSASVQLQHFSQQLILEKLKFTACGFFDINFELLCTIVGVVTTYLVILIQMDRKIICSS